MLAMGSNHALADRLALPPHMVQGGGSSRPPRAPASTYSGSYHTQGSYGRYQTQGYGAPSPYGFGGPRPPWGQSPYENSPSMSPSIYSTPNNNELYSSAGHNLVICSHTAVEAQKGNVADFSDMTGSMSMMAHSNGTVSRIQSSAGAKFVAEPCHHQYTQK